MKATHGRKLHGVPWIALGVAVAACGDRGLPTPRHGGEPPAPQATEVHGTRVAALRTAKTGPASLSLFIDAGSRDAEPPQVATVSALLAAEAAGPRFEARVTPDGTELEGQCPVEELEGCLAGLARGLSLRAVEPEALARARSALTSRRRRARADETRDAHRLALRALLGEDDARTLDPLGTPDGDEATDGPAIEAFLRSHYGPRRTLVAASGAIQPPLIIDAVQQAFDGLPDATAPRGVRPDWRPRTSVAVEMGDRGALVAAAPVPSAAHGRTVAHGVLEAFPGHGLQKRQPAKMEAHAFDLRGQSFVLVRATPVYELRAATGALAFELGRALLETPPPATARPRTPEEPDPARALGRRWLVEAEDPPPKAHPDAERPDPTAERPVHVGIGAILPGSRADRTRASDPDALVRRSARGRLATVLQASMDALQPRHRGSVHDDGAQVVLDNGARVDVRRTPHHRRVRLRVRIAGGAAEDPPALHGRAALHATLMSRGCRGTPADALRLRLRRLDATWAPEVGVGAFGFVIDAPREKWREVLDLAVACVWAPDLSDTALDRARTALAQAGAQSPPYRAWAARVLAPRSPGVVAPWGATDTLAHVDRADVLRAHGERVVGARTRLAVRGDVPPREVVARAARRLARLPPGRLPASPRPVPSQDEPMVLDPSGDPVTLVMAWRLGGDAATRQAAAFAERMAAVVASEAPAHPPWSGGGGAPWDGWAAVAIVVPREAVGSIGERARAMGPQVADDLGIDEVHMVGPVLGSAPD